MFSPREARELLYAAKRAARKSKVQPSQVCRRKTTLKRKPREFYSRFTYGSAVACIQASVPHWHPNQLRHSRATEVRGAFGLETGHSGDLLCSPFASAVVHGVCIGNAECMGVRVRLPKYV